MSALSTLAPGTRCWVHLQSQLWPGIVLEQSAFDEAVRVETPAAALVRAPWKSMSFRWRDGKAMASPWDGRIVLATCPEEREEFDARVAADEQSRKIKWARQHQLAGPQGEFWWQD